MEAFMGKISFACWCVHCNAWFPLPLLDQTMSHENLSEARLRISPVSWNLGKKGWDICSPVFFVFFTSGYIDQDIKTLRKEMIHVARFHLFYEIIRVFSIFVVGSLNDAYRWDPVLQFHQPVESIAWWFGMFSGAGSVHSWGFRHNQLGDESCRILAARSLFGAVGRGNPGNMAGYGR